MLRLIFLLIVSASCMAQNVTNSAFAKAEFLLKSGDYDKARPLFEKQLESNPNDLKTLEYLGDIGGFVKDWDEAIPYYEKLVALEPKVAKYHYKYGGVLGMKALEVNKFSALGLLGDIKRAFETAARLDPKYIDARWALVELYIQLPGIIGGSEAKAKRYADELAQLSPVDGYLAHGYIAEYNDSPEEAERNYRAAVAVGGSVNCFEKVEEHTNTATKPEGSSRDEAGAGEKPEVNNRLHYQLGKVAGQYGIGLDQGIACLDKYIQKYTTADGVPKDWAYLRLAQIYKHKGNKSLAQRWIDKALASRPDFKEALEEKEIIKNL